MDKDTDTVSPWALARVAPFSGILLACLFLIHPVPILADEPLKVVVSLLPLSEFVREVGKDKVHLTVMIPPGAEPHTYEPTPNQLKEASRADVYVKVGTALEFEIFWLGKLLSLNESMVVCDSSKGIELIRIAEEIGNDGHRFGWYADPHIWLSPRRVRQMVNNIKEALIQMDPVNASFYLQNAQEFTAQLEELDREITARLNPFSGRSFLTVHPEWGYFAMDYRLEQISLESEGKEPTAGELAHLLKLAKEKEIHAILVSPQFSRKTAEVIVGEINAKLIVTDALAEDYVKNLRQVTDQMANAFQ